MERLWFSLLNTPAGVTCNGNGERIGEEKGRG